MNTFVFGVISKRLEEKGLNVHEVFNMSNKQAKKELFDDLYYYVLYTKKCGAELTMVALDADELMHYFISCYMERYAYRLKA